MAAGGGERPRAAAGGGRRRGLAPPSGTLTFETPRLDTWSQSWSGVVVVVSWGGLNASGWSGVEWRQRVRAWVGVVFLLFVRSVLFLVRKDCNMRQCTLVK